MAEKSHDVARETPRQQRKAWIWIMLMVNVVFLLVLMTLGIIALRVGNYLPEGTDILFIVGKNPEVNTTLGSQDHDSTGSGAADSEDGSSESAPTNWETNKDIEIFKSSYSNGEGTPTVVSQDGTELIAPGTETTYKFSMYNSGNMAVTYSTDIDFALHIGDSLQSDDKEALFPLKIRMFNQSGEYIIGSENDYVNVSDALISKHRSVLGANSYETFTVELIWEFEGGNDELDTLFGDLSASQGVTLTLGIDTYAEEHLDPEAEGGISIDGEKDKEIGGTIRWVWVILLMVNTAVIIFYVSWLMNKRLQKW